MPFTLREVLAQLRPTTVTVRKGIISLARVKLPPCLLDEAKLVDYLEDLDYASVELTPVGDKWLVTAENQIGLEE